MAQGAKLESADLYLRQGSSDKEYHASLEEAGSGKYVVNFAYGRRGSALKADTKTASPVDLPTARKIYGKLIAEKTAKGYQPGEGGADYVPAAQLVDPSTGQCQLLNAIDEEQAILLCHSSEYIAQEKMDGVRMGISRRDGKYIATNRRAKAVGFSRGIQEALDGVSGDFQIDGETIGETYYAFDILSDDSGDLTSLAVEKRIEKLSHLLAKAKKVVVVVPTSTATKAKRALIEEVKARGGEGIVFKRKGAQYAPGRPASGGDWLKWKFTETATARVKKANAGKRSVLMEMSDDNGAWIDVGNVTVLPNFSIPAIGSHIEVEYLYAFRGGSLFQPVLRQIRTDMTDDDCTTDQLKYKE